MGGKGSGVGGGGQWREGQMSTQKKRSIYENTRIEPILYANFKTFLKIVLIK